MSERPPLFVTRSYLPPQEDFLRHVDGIFSSRQLTNQAGLVRDLEAGLGAFLGLDHVLACANGTLALMMGLRLAGLSGKKVITTPFTYVATLSAIMWEGCTPLFADIDPETLCLSPQSLQDCLKRHPDCAGVVPVHVFGNACDVLSIEEICREHGLVCLYDAAHAFGASYKGRSLLDYGDYAVCSFHATKLFHCAEGGCLVVHNEKDRQRTVLLRAFGHIGDEHYSLGFNAKLSELHAAMGLAVLPRVPELIEERRKACAYYDAHLPQGRYARPRLAEGLSYNYAYFPIVLEDEKTLLALMSHLARESIFPRRYFYPSLTTLPYLPESAKSLPCPVADDVAPRILCLPLAAGMREEELAQVCGAVGRFFA